MIEKIYDCAIIGGGPAGVTAAIYLSRANKSVILFEKEIIGGQINNSPCVENIPGFDTISGQDYGIKLMDQLEYNNIEVIYDEVIDVSSIGVKIISTYSKECYFAKSVIIASGTKHRTLNLENEDKFIGKGISFCVKCDGAFYRDKIVAVVGGGNSALQEAIELSSIAKHVIILQDLDHLTGENKLQEKIKTLDNVSIKTNVKVIRYIGDNQLTGLEIVENGNKQMINVDGVFLAIGLVPNNKPFENVVNLNSYGYIASVNDFSGVYAAGDCLQDAVRQVVTAEASGVLAANIVIKFLEK